MSTRIVQAILVAFAITLASGCCSKSIHAVSIHDLPHNLDNAKEVFASDDYPAFVVKCCKNKTVDVELFNVKTGEPTGIRRSERVTDDPDVIEIHGLKRQAYSVRLFVDAKHCDSWPVDLKP